MPILEPLQEAEPQNYFKDVPDLDHRVQMLRQALHPTDIQCISVAQKALMYRCLTEMEINPQNLVELAAKMTALAAKDCLHCANRDCTHRDPPPEPVKRGLFSFLNRKQ